MMASFVEVTCLYKLTWQAMNVVNHRWQGEATILLLTKIIYYNTKLNSRSV